MSLWKRAGYQTKSNAFENLIVERIGLGLLTLCLPWGPMDPKMKFDLSLLRTHSKHDLHIT